MVFAPGCLLSEERGFWPDEEKRVENLFQRNNLLSLITKPITLFLIGVIRIYQLFISPFLGANCRFQPTCSHYVIESIQKKSGRNQRKSSRKLEAMESDEKNEGVYIKKSGRPGARGCQGTPTAPYL